MNFDDTARFFGHSEKLWPELFKGATKHPTGRSFPQWKYPPQAWWPGLPGKSGNYTPQSLPKISGRLCENCKKEVIGGNRRYCGQCARAKKLAANRESYRKGRDSGKVRFSPIGAEALTEPKTPIRYHHPQTSVSDSSFSTALAANTATNAQ